MAKALTIDPAVIRRLRELPKSEKVECLLALCELTENFGQPHSHGGLSIRKLGNKLFGCRGSLALRFVFQNRPTELFVSYLGNPTKSKNCSKSVSIVESEQHPEMLRCVFGYLQQPFSGPTQIPYADCFAAATAIKEKATVVTGDPEFRKVEGLVGIDWLGGKKEKAGEYDTRPLESSNYGKGSAPRITCCRRVSR